MNEIKTRCDGCDQEENSFTTCESCGYSVCGECLDDKTFGVCDCTHENFGDAYCDLQEHSIDYKGPYKPYLQIEMENILMMCDWEAFKCCCARDCGKNLENTGFLKRKFCKCGCVVYCSEKCKQSALLDKQHRVVPNVYRCDGHEEDMKEDRTNMFCHADLCEPYMAPRKWPAIGKKLKQYYTKFGHYPGPFFPPPAPLDTQHAHPTLHSSFKTFDVEFDAKILGLTVSESNIFLSRPQTPAHASNVHDGQTQLHALTPRTARPGTPDMDRSRPSAATSRPVSALRGWIHVLDVQPGSVASTMGVQKGDIIIALEGDPSQHFDEFSGYLARMGRPLTIRFARRLPEEQLKANESSNAADSASKVDIWTADDKKS